MPRSHSNTKVEERERGDLKLDDERLRLLRVVLLHVGRWHGATALADEAL